MTDPSNLSPPDGGWGWMVVFGCALINVFNQSLVSVFGLLFGSYLTELGEDTTGTALVMNLCSLSLNFSGLIIGPLMKSYSPRKVSMMGSLLTGTGLILCSISTKLWHVVIFYSIFVGFGLGLISPSSFIAVNLYFSKKRGQAVGLALAGTGLGQMLMPQLVSFLLYEYSFRGTALIMGGLALNGVVGASLFQPVKWHLKASEILIHDDETQLLLPKNMKIDDHFKKDSWRTKLVQILDLKLLRNLTFVNISFGLGLAYTASINFSMLLPYYLQQTANLNQSDTAFCMSILAGADLLSRLTLPTITDKLKITCRSTFLIAATLLVVIRSVLAETRERQSLFIVCAVYGLIRAVTIVNQNLTVAEYCHQRGIPNKLPNALGLNMFAKGLFVITVGQLLGWIRDYTDSYSLCIHAQNVLLVIVIVMWLSEICLKRKNIF